MKRLMNNIAKLVRKFVNEYTSAMNLYGKYLLYSRSYGC
jgi:hypothetical protein